jgi:hypothetical protein
MCKIVRSKCYEDKIAKGRSGVAHASRRQLTKPCAMGGISHPFHMVTKFCILKPAESTTNALHIIGLIDDAPNIHELKQDLTNHPCIRRSLRRQEYRLPMAYRFHYLPTPKLLQKFSTSPLTSLSTLRSFQISSCLSSISLDSISPSSLIPCPAKCTM